MDGILFCDARENLKEYFFFCFCFGLRAAEVGNLPPLTEAQKNKLRHLSVVTLASKLKVAYLSFPCLFCSLFRSPLELGL